MPTDSPQLAALTPVVRAFVQSHRIPSDAIRSEGRVVLTVDQHWRVHLIPAPHHRVALQSELLALPEQADKRTDDALVRICKAAAGLMQDHASTLAIDARRRALVLQHQVPAGADLRVLEDALADFTNALAFFSRLCRTQANLLEGNAA